MTRHTSDSYGPFSLKIVDVDKLMTVSPSYSQGFSALTCVSLYEYSRRSALVAGF